MSSVMDNWCQPDTYTYSGMQMGDYTNLELCNEVAEYGDFKDGDCIVASYPKTGTTLTQEIVYLIYNDGDVEKAKAGNLHERFPFIEFDMGHKYPDFLCGLGIVKEYPHPKLVKTHLLFDNLSGKAKETVKFVYVARNPKDMLVSYFYFYRSHDIFGSFPGTFGEFVELQYSNRLDYGNYFNHLRQWVRAAKEYKDKILVIKYDLIKDKFGQVKLIAEFSGKTLSDDTIRRIVRHTSFSEMKNNPSVNGESTEEVEMDNPKKSPFIRKGEIGDWKNHFTVAENKRFDKYIQKEMEDIDIDFEYE